jgi:catechol 2,3-dioxygenase-like lactoylglutathione lyase family enzyme
MAASGVLTEVTVGVADLDARVAEYGALGLVAARHGTIGASAAALFPAGADRSAVVLHRPDVTGGVRLRLVATGGEAARGQADVTAPGPVGIGFTTTDPGALCAALTGHGAAFLSPPVRVGPPGQGPADPTRFEAFARLRDGEFIVVIERRNMPAPYGTIAGSPPVSEPLHTSHSVADLDACRRLFTRVLSHEVLVRETCEGPDFERLMGLAPGTSFVFEMLKPPAHPTGRIVLMAFPPGGRHLPAPDGPRRGIAALRYDVDDLAAALAAVPAAGGEIVAGPLQVRDPVLGAGRAAAVASPLGTPIELWEPIPEDP